MKPLAELPSLAIDGLFFDVDDTLLTHGVLTRDAYAALWDLHEAGLKLVAVTGRPSGWGEVFARNWPIDGAVTENGAVFVVRAGKGIERIHDPIDRRLLRAVMQNVKDADAELVMTDDAHARLSDVTWDIGEHRVVSEERIRSLQAVIVASGARTTRSSVHVHATFSGEDKASGAIRFVRERFGVDPGTALARWAFIGDSPNDAACFGALRHTFGVANVRPFASRMSVPPRWISPSERGEGFAEIARAILAKRVR